MFDMSHSQLCAGCRNRNFPYSSALTACPFAQRIIAGNFPFFKNRCVFIAFYEKLSCGGRVPSPSAPELSNVNIKTNLAV